MDLRRLRQLSGMKRPLFESVTPDPALNADIERRLVTFPGEMQTQILDALEALQTGNELSASEWMRAVRQLHPDADVGKVLTTVVREFDCCVKKLGDKRYGFVASRAVDDGIENMDPATKSAISMQVGLTYDALEAMGEKDSFTRDDLHTFLTGHGLRGSQVEMFADHLLNHFGAESLGGDRFRIPQDEPVTKDDTMDFLRGIANDPTGFKPR
jgi:hypothetical protein